jgi:hypothetical protein
VIANCVFGNFFGHRRLRVGQQEAGGDDRVVALAGDRREVRDVVVRRVRLDRAGLHAELGLGQLQPGELVLVEPLVVEAADVADERGPERHGRRGAAGSGEQRDREDDRRHGKCNRQETSFGHPNPPSKLPMFHRSPGRGTPDPTPSDPRVN